MPLILRCARCGVIVVRVEDLGGRPLREIIGGKKCRRCGAEIEGKVVGKLTITPTKRRKQI